MQKLHFSILIKAPREKVWKAMLEDATYREWTMPFHPGSYYKGDWSKGSKMLFIGPDPETDKEAGMVSRIAENKPNEFISIEHVGIIEDGKEITTGEVIKKWAPAFENYTFNDRDGNTELVVDMDSDDEYKEMFEQVWPEALERLKDIAEGRAPKTIIINAIVNAPMAKVWEYWNGPKHIVRWAFAADDWEAPEAENDLRVGGKFKTVMAAKDKSTSFDFTGTYTVVKEHKLIEYDMDDGRHVKVQFNQFPEGVHIIQSFEPENENSKEMQQSGWQAILNNFKKYAEKE